ncbi:unnamed protein product [Caenorhabditis angaria]|uniref:Ion channel n=1 Tax=Caenorhabditis angaria TaxID=860376 RepID=A0A9P1I653_9PELO|nr:unnamed protein product [Caenorhabditis angaria]
MDRLRTISQLYTDRPRPKAGSVQFSANSFEDDTISQAPSSSSTTTSTSFETTPRMHPSASKASQLIVDVPVAQLRKIKNTEGVGSIARESEHFSNTTTLHGPKRIYNGKRWSIAFWIIVMVSSMILLFAQVTSLINMFFSRPTVSQVSFLLSEGGMVFPRVTVCSFNPIKRTYVESLNSTKDLSDDLLDYLMMFNSDAMTLYGRADGQQLHSGDNLFKQYVQNHTNFTADSFFMDAGFGCNDTFKMCSFGGRRFDCCKYATPVFSDLGKCFTLNVQDSDKPWMKTQSEPGIAAGLQIILDSHIEEQFDSEADGVTPVFSSAFENGFRYYIHSSAELPFLASEGIAVSPDSVVYSALSSSRYILLSSGSWGNCTDSWPANYKYDFPYTAAMCSTVCKAQYFNTTCGCSPSIYNHENLFRDCTPYETYRCMDTKMKVVSNGVVNIEMPSCEECRVECKSQVYHAFNSYGKGLSRGALMWLHKQGQWDILHMKSNFQVVNVFFRDMSYTEYIQMQGMTITELLSDIGGNMGMFMGMSVFTIIEVSLFLSKIGWLAFSRKRRDYMYSKKKNEELHEKELEDVVTGFKLFRTRKIWQ